MKGSPAEARILVASDNVDDARMVAKQLGIVFDNVRTSTEPDKAVTDFQAFVPDLLVLAFDTLEKCERHYLGLYRLGGDAMHGRHRTVVLCSNDDAQLAFELCRKDYFDDYVLFWPHNHDGRRLAMSVWIACRQHASEDQRPGSAALLLHARHLKELEHVLATSDSGPALLELLRPSLEGTRPLAAAVRTLAPTIMVIDDDAFSQELVMRSLDPSRWHVIVAGDGAQALALLRRSKVDLILMDIRLPGLDGVSLTRHLKGSPATAAIPIVMMTGDSRRATLEGSMDAGAVGFVVKPVSRATLDSKLDKLLPR